MRVPIIFMLSLWAYASSAQPIFKCGTTYTDEPCKGAVVLRINPEQNVLASVPIPPAPREPDEPNITVIDASNRLPYLPPSYGIPMQPTALPTLPRGGPAHHAPSIVVTHPTIPKK